MVTAQITPAAVVLRFRPWEKLAGLLRDTEIPRAAIREVEVLPDGYAAVRGFRAPGLALPGVRKLGTWRGRGGKTLVAVRKGEPAVRLTLAGHRYDSVLVGTPDPQALAARLG